MMNNFAIFLIGIVCSYCCSFTFAAPRGCTITRENTVLGDMYSTLNRKSSDEYNPKNCRDIYESGSHESGIYTIYVKTADDSPFRMPREVYCDMTIQGGGWTVILKRKPLTEEEENKGVKSVNFTKPWNDYVDGFGRFNQEYMMGLEMLHRITHETDMEVYIGLESNVRVGRRTTPCDIHGYAKYSRFFVKGRRQNYALTIDEYDSSSTIGNSLVDHNVPFSTYDEDNDKSDSSNCAHRFRSGWWYHQCHDAHLTGTRGGSTSDGITWPTWKDSLKSVIMAIRPAKSTQN